MSRLPLELLFRHAIDGIAKFRTAGETSRKLVGQVTIEGLNCGLIICRDLLLHRLPDDWFQAGRNRALRDLLKLSAEGSFQRRQLLRHFLGDACAGGFSAQSCCIRLLSWYWN